MAHLISLQNTASLVAIVVCSGLVACGSSAGSKDDGTATCGGNGEMDEAHGHCHCDEGFDLSADGMDCVPSADQGSDDEQGTPGGSDTGAEGSNFAPGSVVGVLYRGASPYHVLTAKEGRTWLTIANYPSLGGAAGPETRPVGTTESSYATCGVCIMLEFGCQVHGDHSHCEATLMPEVGGDIIFDALGSAPGDAWTGSLAGVRFVEVAINGRTYETTPVADGRTFDLGTWDFDVLLESN